MERVILLAWGLGKCHASVIWKNSWVFLSFLSWFRGRGLWSFPSDYRFRHYASILRLISFRSVLSCQLSPDDLLAPFSTTSTSVFGSDSRIGGKFTDLGHLHRVGASWLRLPFLCCIGRGGLGRLVQWEGQGRRRRRSPVVYSVIGSVLFWICHFNLERAEVIGL